MKFNERQQKTQDFTDIHRTNITLNILGNSVTSDHTSPTSQGLIKADPWPHSSGNTIPESLFKNICIELLYYTVPVLGQAAALVQSHPPNWQNWTHHPKSTVFNQLLLPILREQFRCWRGLRTPLPLLVRSVPALREYAHSSGLRLLLTCLVHHSPPPGRCIKAQLIAWTLQGAFGPSSTRFCQTCLSPLIAFGPLGRPRRKWKSRPTPPSSLAVPCFCPELECIHLHRKAAGK